MTFWPIIETFYGWLWLVYGIVVFGLTIYGREWQPIFLQALNFSGLILGIFFHDLLTFYEVAHLIPVSFMAIDTVILGSLIALLHPTLANETHRDSIRPLIFLTVGWYLIHGLQLAGVFPSYSTYGTMVNAVYVLFGYELGRRPLNGILVDISNYYQRVSDNRSRLWGWRYNRNRGARNA